MTRYHFQERAGRAPDLIGVAVTHGGIRTGVLLIVMSVLVSACAANSTLTQSPTYTGNAAAARLQDVHLQMSDGSSVPFTAVFPGYKSDNGMFVLTFPRRRDEFDIALVPNRAYQTLFRGYDANGNGYLERPEMVVMYVQEAAKGLGKPVTGIGIDGPVRALQSPRADIGGLLRFIKAHASDLSLASRTLFNDMDWIVEEIRSSQEGGHEFGT